MRSVPDEPNTTERIVVFTAAVISASLCLAAGLVFLFFWAVSDPPILMS